MVIGVTILYSGFWMPLGAIVALVVWLVIKAGRTTRTLNDPGC